MGSSGVSNKINDTAWTVEEQYFNSTLSLADKGKMHNEEVETCGSEMVCRNVSPRLQHLLEAEFSFRGCFGLGTEERSQY